MTKSKIKFPIKKGSVKFKEFVAHYRKVLGKELGFEEIVERIYQGKPLKQLYSHIEFTASKKQLKKTSADIRLYADKDGKVKEDLVIENVSLKQFLVAGLPYNQCGTLEGCPVSGPWDGNGHWDEFHQQYRLELCHSEISRWSLFFMEENKKDKTKGVLANDLKENQISGHENISRIELVNNCTTTKGFEFRVRYKGELYHLSLIHI